MYLYRLFYTFWINKSSAQNQVKNGKGPLMGAP